MNSTQNPQQRPLSTREDIEMMVNRFYDKVFVDQLIGPIFTDVAKTDWKLHLPKMYNFWEDLLLGTQNYHGRPFPPHIPLNLKPEHFERWISLFIKTVDDHFTGLLSEEAKARALRIAMNFKNNIALHNQTGL